MIKVYKDAQANAIFFEDSNGVQFLNSVQATVDNSLVTVVNLARDLNLISDVSHSEFVDENDNSYGADAVEVCDALNALFSDSGTPLTNEPVITSPLSINLVEGETLNYELTTDYGVSYEWDFSNVPGVALVEGSSKKIIGGSSLAAGSYNIPVKAINYNGEDSETIALTVSNPPFANTKSVQFDQNDWAGANAALLDSILGRTGNGAGAGDAWSISFYFKPNGSSNQEQTIFYFGANDVANGNHIRIKWNGANNAREQVIFRYGTNNNNIQLKTPVNSVINNAWHHFLVTYDGGTTGASSGDISNYYSRFKIFIDGVQQTTTNSHSNYGITTALSGQNLRIGRYNSSGYLRGCKVDELAIWGSDQSANISSIYNSGTPFDLSTLGTAPDHWWRMADGDTFPYLQDSGSVGGCIFQMYNMASVNFTSDVPT